MKAKRGAISSSMIDKFKKREWAENEINKISMDYTVPYLSPPITFPSNIFIFRSGR